VGVRVVWFGGLGVGDTWIGARYVEEGHTATHTATHTHTWIGARYVEEGAAACGAVRLAAASGND